MKVWFPVVLIWATGCSSLYSARYTFVLEEVETSSAVRGKIDGLQYEEANLATKWRVSPVGIGVEVSNRSGAPLELAWDEKTIYEASELPKSIAPNAKAEFSVHPLENTREAPAKCFKAIGVDCAPPFVDHRRRLHLPVCKASNLKIKECGWVVREPLPLLPLAGRDPEALSALAGKKLRVVLPFASVPHTFVFRVDKVETEKVPEGAQELPPGIVGACPCKKRSRSDEP